MARPGRLARLFSAVGVLLGLCYALQPASPLAQAASLLIGMGTVAALLGGPRLNSSPQRAVWRLLAAACLMFLLGVIIRPWAVAQSGLQVLAADVFTLTGYALLIGGLTLLLRAAGSLDRNAVIDGLIVSLGATAPAVQYLALPAMAITGRPVVVSLLAGLYPTIDVLVMFIIVNLAFSTAVRLVSFRLLALAGALLLTGDLGYAIIGTRGELVGPAIMDLPFMFGFVALGTVALHPSMARFASIVPQPVQPWSLLRLSLIIPALTAPFVVLLATSEASTGRRVAVLLSGMLSAALVARAVTAVRRLAETQAVRLHQATHDTLTGLPNRMLLATTLDAQLANAGRREQVWLLYLDLDGFKLVNDHWGHEIGDQMLTHVADRLRGLVGPGDMVARIGGDEFVVLGTGDEQQALNLSESLHKMLGEPIRLLDFELVTTASVGIVPRSDQESTEALLRDADMAMYRSKEAGRDRSTLFRPEMRDSVRRRVETELALRVALKGDELWVAFQPLTCMADQRVLGAEALVRWDHPVRGAVVPQEFISVAEETGLINELGEWVLSQSLHQLALWRSAGRVDDEFSMSVNVSARQLAGDGLITFVERELRRLAIPASCLTIELTESALMVDADRARTMLQNLRDIGVQIAVDDFGTGYSSLSYLSKLPVTGVKIDRSFVRDLGVRRSDEIIAKAIVAMAHALGLVVTAEGVETVEQYKLLREIGAGRGQGWLWGKAVCGIEFGATYLGWHPTATSQGSRMPSTLGRRDVSARLPG